MLCYNNAVRIAIVGLGLIGGSLGLALKKSRWRDAEIIGCARRQKVAAAALRLRAVDTVEMDLQKAVSGADMIIIATPILTIREVFVQTAPSVSHKAIVTDTGSTKLQVMQWAKEFLSPNISFIGGHPMAGKETSGIEAAEAELFQGRVYCLTPGEETAQEAVCTLEDMVTAIGAVPFIISPEEHDNLVAGVSHLPLLLSVALVLATTQSPVWDKMSRLAASGYRDVTRLASGSPEMHAHICSTNKEAIVTWIDVLITELQRLRRMVSESDASIESVLALAKEARQRWLREHGSER
jgi:prephenate dehydrogenase